MCSVHPYVRLLLSLPFNEYRKPGAETLTSRIFSLTGRILLQCARYPLPPAAAPKVLMNVSIGRLIWIPWQVSYAPKGPNVNSRGRKPVEEERKKSVRPEWADETFPRMRTAFFREHTPFRKHLRSYRS